MKKTLSILERVGGFSVFLFAGQAFPELLFCCWLELPPMPVNPDSIDVNSIGKIHLVEGLAP